MVEEAQKLIRKEEKKRKREAMAVARANGEDVESLVSSTLLSEKSGSKKSAMGRGGDHKSAQSPNAHSQRPGDDQSKS
jgi:hypothetical protein